MIAEKSKYVESHEDNISVMCISMLKNVFVNASHNWLINSVVKK